VPVQRLQLVARVARPHLARLVAARSDDLVALGVELDFADFIFVALQQRRARPREHIVDARDSVCARSC